MTATIMKVVGVRPHGDNLSIVTVSNGMEVIANRKEDGSFRWQEGEAVIYVAEGSIVPDDVLKDRGYWDNDKDRGLLEGNKRNRVKMRRMAGFESRGLLFKVGHPGLVWGEETPPEAIGWIVRDEVNGEAIFVTMGQDVTEFLGITEHA